jgi:hypothetical protein
LPSEQKRRIVRNREDASFAGLHAERMARYGALLKANYAKAC